MNKEKRIYGEGLSLPGVFRKFFLGFLFYAVALCAVGCAVVETQEVREPDLRVAVTPGVEAAPLLAALESNLFDDAGVEIVLVSGRDELITLFKSGAVNGAAGSLFNLIELQEQGFLALAASTSGAEYLLVTGTGAVEIGEGLSGITIAASENVYEQYLLETLLEMLELDPAEPDYLYAATPEKALNALDTGQADAAFLPVLIGEEALWQGALLMGSMREYELPGGVIFFSGEALQESEPQIRAFYRGYQAALKALNRGEIELLSPLVEKWGFPGGWLEAPPANFLPPRPLTRDEVNDALAWLTARQSLDQAPLFESLVWREQLPE